MPTSTRHAPDEVRRGHHTLSLSTWQPRNCSKLAAVKQFHVSEEPAETQDFEPRLCADRNRWDLARRRGGLFVPDRRIGKLEAERLLRNKLAELAGESAI